MKQQEMPGANLIQLFTHSIVSNHAAIEVAEKMPEACAAYKFALLQTYDYYEIVKSKGFPIERKVFIFEICQAKLAAQMLTSYPGFSVFMPCKIAVYEADGHTVIATMNMDMMLQAIESDKDLHQEASTLFASLKDLMESLSK